MVWKDSIVVLTEFRKTQEEPSPKLQRTCPLKTHQKTPGDNMQFRLKTPNTLEIRYIISEPPMEAVKMLSGSSPKNAIYRENLISHLANISLDR